MKWKFFLLALLTGILLPVSAQSLHAWGKPFIVNFSALEYNAHNRNFDIACDSTGRVYVANFEGLLIYDGVNWKTIHTPKITRVSRLYKASDGRIWFGGHNFIGFVKGKYGNEVEYISSDADNTQSFGEVNQIFEQGQSVCFSTSEQDAYRIEKKKIIRENLRDIPEDDHSVVTLSNVDKVFATTENMGLTVSDLKGKLQYVLTTEDGLCSNIINAIASDGKGCVWGATDNGLFVVSTSNVFTHFTEKDGLIGQVTSIFQNERHLYVGTLQGLYFLKNTGRFEKVSGIDQACWQLLDEGKDQVLAASADGLFLCGKTVMRLTSKHTLSVFIESPGSYLTGELDGIYRHTAAGKETKIDEVENAVKLEKDSQGGIWAYTLYSGSYYKSPSSAHFVKKQGPKNLMLNYVDKNGTVWTSGNGGLGLKTKGLPEGVDRWLKPLDASSIQAMFVYQSVAWFGGTFGIIRMDMDQCRKSKPLLSKLYVRSFDIDDDENVYVSVSSDKMDVIGSSRYSYRLQNDDRWSKWDDDNDIDFLNLSYGNYVLTIRSMDSYGNISETEPIPFSIPYPVYLRWYAQVSYALLLILLIYLIYLWRTNRLRSQQQKLEKLVNSRTQQLKDAQQQLISQEREITVGKLTKGLIDRILNPMNYINNFSHLTTGLIKDMKEDIEDDADKMTPDNYDDVMDVLDMMKTNLEKIEQHGLSTTRILKAMEAMLKERNTSLVPTDLTAMLQQNVQMLAKYYEKDIQKMDILIQWEKPAEAIQANVLPEGMSKTIMSMFENSIYAIRKRYEKNLSPVYRPEIRLTLRKETDHICIQVYDNGIGIEEQIIGKVFDPFFTTKPTADAPGVGLYISQQIIQFCGGDITVDSQKEQYTEFTITLPFM